MRRSLMLTVMIAGLGGGGSAECATDGLKGIETKVAAVKKSLDETFIVEAHSPFVIAGNIPLSRFDSCVKYTILGSYRAFYRDFFDKKPDKIITIYLFKENLTYRKWASALFGDTDVSHFGYYKPDKCAIVMNIGTGGGTLVHEMAHAFIHVDFPDCPAWFDEGMGTLFEQCTTTGGHIKGLMNWRFPILKRGLGNQRYTPMAKLIAMNTSQFYKDPFTMHYAQARYFCMYLQEKDWLRKFYKQFRDNYQKDPTGLKTLEDVTGKKLGQLEEEWLVWARKQRYEER